MLPFIPPFANQNQMHGGNDPSPNQFPSPSNGLPNQFGFNNPQILMPAMGGFNNQNALLSTLLTQQHLMQGLQNNLIGALLQQGIMPQLHGQQLNLFGALQRPNFMPLQQVGFLGRPPMGQNMNQMMGFSSNGLLGSQNPNFPPNSQLPVKNSGNSNPGFLGNGSTQVGQSLNSSTGLESQMASQKIQEPVLLDPVQNNKSNGRRQWPQMMHGQAGGKNFSNNSSENVASKNFKPKTFEQGKRESSHMRFQKTQAFNSRNACQKESRFPKNNRRGQRQRKERITKFSTSDGDNTPPMRKRPFSVIYSESEIKQWREARKKSFPTRANVETKLNPSSAMKEDIVLYAEVRRQQLKEVLAKQAELGLEVAEIPSIYLTEPRFSVIYSESEIQQWREARKKNFPTRANIETKLNPSSAMKEDIVSYAKVRQQQLKEVLAKQAELGVEVAQIPSIYLTEPGDQRSQKTNSGETLNTNIKSPSKRFKNNKRGRTRCNKGNAKRMKFENEAAAAHEPVVRKREPTLLRKLLNSEIRRDKSHLLQAFRFMVLNSFFKDLPDKTLVFPIITTKDADSLPEIVVEKKPLDVDDSNFMFSNGNAEEVESKKYSTVVGEVKSECDEDDDIDGASDVYESAGEKSEEGEITD